jgi:hypothetical protein
MGQFRVEWEDFSGGFFVGPNDADQPRNTWTGTGMTVSADQSMLMPAAAVTQVTGMGTIVASVQNFQQFGAPITISGIYSGSNPVRQMVTWAAPAFSPDYDMKFYWTDGTNLDASTVLGTSGDFYFPTGRPVAMPSAANYKSAVAYYPVARNIAGVFTYFIYSVNTNSSAVAGTSIPIRLHLLARWKEWVVGTQYETNRLHFSAPLGPTSWGASDYVEIGAGPVVEDRPTRRRVRVHVGQGLHPHSDRRRVRLPAACWNGRRRSPVPPPVEPHRPPGFGGGDGNPVRVAPAELRVRSALVHGR